MHQALGGDPARRSVAKDAPVAAALALAVLWSRHAFAPEAGAD